MRKLTSIIIAFLLCISANAQSKRVISDLKPFSNIVLAPGINLILTQSSEASAKIVGERSVISKVVLQVEDSTLSIFTTKFKWTNSKKIDIHLSFDSTLVSIVGTSGNRVRCESAVKADYLELQAKNGSDFYFNLDTKKVKAKSITGSNIRLVGKADIADLYADNGSSMKAFSLLCDNVSMTATLASRAELSATTTLNISAANDSEIRYKGDPINTQINTISGSRVLPVE